MKRKIAWLVLSCLMVAALILASCAPAAPEEEKPAPPTTEKPTPPKEEEKPAPPKEEKPTPSVTEGPKYGGVLTHSMADPPLHFDETFGTPATVPTLHITNEELFEGDWAKGPAGTGETTWLYHMMPPPYVITGALAESWEMPDDNTMVFHIRQGVHFHNKPPTNGRELVADDIVFSLKRLW